MFCLLHWSHTTIHKCAHQIKWRPSKIIHALSSPSLIDKRIWFHIQFNDSIDGANFSPHFFSFSKIGFRPWQFIAICWKDQWPYYSSVIGKESLKELPFRFYYSKSYIMLKYFHYLQHKSKKLWLCTIKTIANSFRVRAFENSVITIVMNATRMSKVSHT